jgi:hypothetical protein
MKRLISALAIGALLLPLAGIAGQKKQKGYARLDFVVVSAAKQKPIRNASVVLHPVDEDGKQERGGVQLKTDADGKTFYEGVPYGKLRVQVIAPRFQTFGEDYEIGQPQQEIVIKLQPPQKQYSIYDEEKKAQPNPEGKKPEEKKQEEKKPE